jgi:hypothetical protein
MLGLDIQTTTYSVVADLIPSLKLSVTKRTVYLACETCWDFKEEFCQAAEILFCIKF